MLSKEYLEIAETAFEREIEQAIQWTDVHGVKHDK